MIPRSLLVLVAGGFAVAIIVALAASTYWERKQTPFQNAPKLIRSSRFWVAKAFPLVVVLAYYLCSMSGKTNVATAQAPIPLAFCIRSLGGTTSTSIGRDQ